MKHTSGPWEAFISGKVVEVQPVNGSMPIVAWSGFDDCFRNLREHQANARLMALSPEMYEALCAIAAARNEYFEADNPNPVTFINNMADFAQIILDKLQEES